MKQKLLLPCFVCLFNFCGFSQNDSTAYQKFYADFSGIYKEISKPPLINYYTLLSNAAAYSFNSNNPLFAKALSEIIKKNKVQEEDALDTLFRKALTEIKINGLWINATDIYTTKKEIFEVYNEAFCRCLNSKFKRTGKVEALLESVQDCTYELVKDTLFINNMKKTGGDNTLNELYNLQQYASLYIYNHCELVNYKLNESIKNYPVYEQYFAGISSLKIQAGENVTRYFKNKQFDSLAMIFPGYKKFIPELNKIITGIKEFSGIAYSEYSGVTTDNIPKITLTYFKGYKNKLAGDIVMDISANAINSTITSIKFTRYKQLKTDDRDKILEVIAN